MRTLPIRLRPGDDIRRALEKIVATHLPNGGFVVCGIGSLNNPRLRLAQKSVESDFPGPFEILTLSGTVTKDSAHIHVSIASGSGQVFGGHLAYGNEVRTTVELLLLPMEDWELGRALDNETGYLELVHSPVERG